MGEVWGAIELAGFFIHFFPPEFDGFYVEFVSFVRTLFLFCEESIYGVKSR